MNKLKELRKHIRAEIIELLKAGELSYDEIAQKAGSTTNTVFVIAKENGLRRLDKMRNSDPRLDVPEPEVPKTLTFPVEV